jgi:hypothetical protein
VRFEPPATTRRMRAIDATTVPTPYLLKGLNDPDSEWNLVEERFYGRLVPGIPEDVTVTFADGTKRRFHPNDHVLIGPVTNRIGSDRQEIREMADLYGWERTSDDSKDLFARGLFSVEVYYEGDTAELARHIRVGEQVAPDFTGPGAKVAALGWLKPPPPDQV